MIEKWNSLSNSEKKHYKDIEKNQSVSFPQQFKNNNVLFYFHCAIIFTGKHYCIILKKSDGTYVKIDDLPIKIVKYKDDSKAIDEIEKKAVLLMYSKDKNPNQDTLQMYSVNYKSNCHTHSLFAMFVSMGIDIAKTLFTDNSINVGLNNQCNKLLQQILIELKLTAKVTESSIQVLQKIINYESQTLPPEPLSNTELTFKVLNNKTKKKQERERKQQKKILENISQNNQKVFENKLKILGKHVIFKDQQKEIDRYLYNYNINVIEFKKIIKKKHKENFEKVLNFVNKL